MTDAEVLDTKPGKPRRRRRWTITERFEALDPYTAFLIGMFVASVIVGAMVLLVGRGLG